MNRRLMNALLWAAGVTFTLSAPAAMAAWPDGKPVSIVVPYAPGGTADALARLIAQHLGTKLSTSVVVVNKAGASGIIGAQAVAQASPDGFTVLYDATPLSINPHLQKLPFDAEKDLLKLIKKYVHKASSPLCGNTIHQDRKFIVRYMPELEEYLHYRNIDVSTIKELARRWYPKVAEGFKKHNKHEALADIHESIEELKYYRQHIMLPVVSINDAGFKTI